MDKSPYIHNWADLVPGVWRFWKSRLQLADKSLKVEHFHHEISSELFGGWVDSPKKDSIVFRVVEK